MAAPWKKLGELKPSNDPLSTALGKRVALAVVTVLLISGALVLNPTPAGVTEDVPAPRTYRATRPIQLVDEGATEAARLAAAEGVASIFVQDLHAGSDARADVSDFFFAVEETQDLASEDPTLTAEERATRQVAALQDEYGDEISDEALLAAVELTEAGRAEVSGETRELVTLILRDPIREEDLEDARQTLAANADLLRLSPGQRELVSEVGQSVLRPTLTLDEEATVLAEEEARDAVDAVVISKQTGENIVERGEVVTAVQVELLRAMGVFDNNTDGLATLASLALLAAMVLAAGAYLAFYDPEVWLDLRELALLAALLVATVWLVRIVVWLVPEVSPYLLPVPAVAMLATLLVNPRVGLLMAVMTTVTVALLGFSTGVYVVAVLVVDIAAIVAMAQMRMRSHLLYAGGFVTFVMGVVAFLATLASTSELESALVAGAYGLIGGLLASVLTYGLLPVLEVAFRVTTDVRLLELANPGHPLLRQLMRSAPGTYNHSITTANLAEAAAEEIGANPLLARVGSYYHDVGKIKRPMFFVENQPPGQNPHDKAAPTLSRLVITSHVKDGVELAREHKLPEEVLAVIQEHQGTTVIQYFYDKASENGAQPSETEFRYPGPKPRSPEAALVMLADGSEAAVRALAKPTVPKIEQTVRRIVKSRLDDGQLDESELTLAQVEDVIGVYTRMLTGVYHSRIEYGRSKARGTSGVKKPTAAVAEGGGLEDEGGI